jgi:hypothetical protein
MNWITRQSPGTVQKRSGAFAYQMDVAQLAESLLECSADLSPITLTLFSNLARLGIHSRPFQIHDRSTGAYRK